MAWSSTKPSAATFDDSNNVDSSVGGSSYGHVMFTANICRGATNTIYVRVQFKRAAYDGHSGASISGTATISGESVTATGTWGAYSSVYTTFATRYYTGTAAANTNVAVSCNIASTGARSVTLRAPAYTTKYTVSYNGNGGSGSTASQSKTYATALTLRQNGFTRAGYAFLHWNTKSDGTGTTYAAGASYTANAAVTLYAIWKKLNIPVYVNAGGTIRQVEKAYANVGGSIKECAVYVNIAGVIKALT